MGKPLSSYEITLQDYLNLTSKEYGVYTIPFSQRNYEWDYQQVDRLFNDFMALGTKQSSIHILNFFTFSEEEDNLRMYDGQQRTVTIILILSVILQKLYQNGDQEDQKAAEQFHDEIISKKDYHGKGASKRKIIFSDEESNSVFYEITNYKYAGNPLYNEDTGEDEHYKLATTRNIVKNYLYVRKVFNQYCESNEVEWKSISDIYDNIIQNAHLIVIKTETDKLARDMFETLNNTGKSLASFYVLKNDLVRTLGEEVVKAPWESIEGAIGDVAGDFLRAVTIAIVDRQNNGNFNISKADVLRHLYSKFPVQESSEQAKDLLNLMEKAAKFYLFITNPNQLTTSDVNKKDAPQIAAFKNLSLALNSLTVKQHYPLLLALWLDGKNLLELNEVQVEILRLSYKNFYFKENRANTITNMIAKLANGVLHDEDDTAKIVKTIRNKEIDDTELEDAIANKINRHDAIIKNILLGTYNVQLDNQPTVISKKKADLEHILPKNPKNDSHWLKVFANEEERMELTRRLGNLTLWYSSDNRSAKNAEFSVKKVKFQKDQFGENQEIADKEDWTREEIEARSQELSQEVVRWLNKTDFK